MALQLVKTATEAIVDLERHCAAISKAKTVDELIEIRDNAAAAELLVRLRDCASPAHADTYEILQRVQRRLGEVCKELPKHPTGGGRPKKTSIDPIPVSKNAKLAELGISKVEASKWSKVATLPQNDFEAAIQVGRELVLKTGRGVSVLKAASKVNFDPDSWGTPEDFAEAGRLVLGGDYDLDPCSNPAGQKVIRAATFWTKQDDCLKQEVWRAQRMWLNPPYSRIVKEIIGRLLEQIDAGNVVSGLVLVNNQTDATWFHAMMARFPVWFSEDRIAFLQNGVPQKGTRQGQSVFCIGADVKTFKAVFEGEFGGRVMVAA